VRCCNYKLTFIVFCTTSTLCKAFGVTLYNLMLKYAHLKLGQAPFGNKAAQAAFFALIKFDVGGHLFSFNDWEHGILRGNVKSKNGCSAPFDRKDPRYQFVMKAPDPRFHFALNRGTRSSLPIHVLSPEIIDQEMEIAAANFCGDSANVSTDTKKRELHLSEIFRSYKNDFVESEKELPVVVASYMKGLQKQVMDRFIESCDGRAIDVKYIPIKHAPETEESCLVFDPSVVKIGRSRGGLRGLLAGGSRSGQRQ
jgi:Protein of unknown function, DUF547